MSPLTGNLQSAKKYHKLGNNIFRGGPAANIWESWYTSGGYMEQNVLPFPCILDQFEIRAHLCGKMPLLASVFFGLMLGCGGCSKTKSQSTTPPSNLVYPQTTITASVGQAITPDTPTVTGTVTSFAVNPSLPAGLSLNSSNGTISGTPTTVAPQADYRVTTTNGTGSTSAILRITVNVAAPSNLVYPQTTITASVGQAITPGTPTVTGTVTSFAVNPALPAGLSLNSSNGTISGTPTTVAPQADYRVTAANGAGSTSATLQITVNVAPPSNLVYPQTTITASVGQAITPDTPTVTGTVTSFAVNPSLPAGLSLNSSNGTISGIPTTASAQADYSVTAANSGGSTTSSITIAIIQAQIFSCPESMKQDFPVTLHYFGYYASGFDVTPGVQRPEYRDGLNILKDVSDHTTVGWIKK